MAKPAKPGHVHFLKQVWFRLPLGEWKKLERAAAKDQVPMSEWLYRIVKPELDKLPEEDA